MEKTYHPLADNIQENIAKIGTLFPEVIIKAANDKRTSGRDDKCIDFEMLRLLLGGELDKKPCVKAHFESRVAFGFHWVGKDSAAREAAAPIHKKLELMPDKSKFPDTSKNMFIAGDNIDALKLLRINFKEKVRMIYIDPPYNTGSRLIYNDRFAMNKADFIRQKDPALRKVPSERMKTSYARAHSHWCNMMYPRLLLSRDLLSENGVIFISIDDHEVDTLKMMCNEIFGEENYIGCAARITKKSNNKGDFWAPNFDYLLTYAKNMTHATPFFGGVKYSAYKEVETAGERKGERYQLVRLYMSNIKNRNAAQRYWIRCPDGSLVIPPGTTLPPNRPNLGDGIWRWTKQKFEAERHRIVIKKVRSSNLLDENGASAKWNVYTKTYLNDVIRSATAKPNSLIENHLNQSASHELKALNIPFDYAKPTSLIQYLATVAGIGSTDIILDFFAGSCSTADAIMQLNAKDGGTRKFIMVQIPQAIDPKNAAYNAGYRDICEIGAKRICRAGDAILNRLPQNQKAPDIGFKMYQVIDSKESS